MTAQPTDPAKQLIEQTKLLVRNVIGTLVSDETYGWSASSLTDHLIDELAGKLQALPPATVKINWPDDREILEYDRIVRAVRDGISQTIKRMDG